MAEAERSKKIGSSAAGAAPIAPVQAVPTASAFKRGQAVLVSYGRVQIMQAVGTFARKGRVVSLKHRRRGWYGVEIGWDVETSAPVIVTAHVSALAAL
jgi:hypothetical protein